MRASKELLRKEAGYQWNIGESEYVAPDHLWGFCNTDGLERGSNDISAEY